MVAAPQSFTDLDRLPGPRGWPLLGNYPQIKADKVHLIFEAWAREFGPLFKVSFGPNKLVCVADAAMIRQILHERPDNYRRRNIEAVADEMGVRGVFMSEGEDWRRQRRIWIKALNAHQIKPFLGELSEVTRRLRRRWLANAAAGTTVDVQAELMRYTVDVVTRFAFGYDGNTLEQDGDVIQNHLHHVFPMLAKRLNMPFRYWRYVKLPVDRRLDRALLAIRAFVDQRIAEARSRIAADPARAAAPRNLLEAFVVARDDDGSGFNDNEIYANTVTALLAGEDTTANTLAWMLHFLSQDPALQAELRATVQDAGVSDPCEPLPEQAAASKLIDAIMSEALRLRPVAPIMGAIALRDVELGGRSYPQGTEFVTLMRYPALSDSEFPQALRFDHRRWLEPGAAHFVQRPPTPFGGGARTCPGRNLAQSEVRAVIAMLARSFVIEPTTPADAVTERFGFTVGPANLRLRFRAL